MEFKYAFADSLLCLLIDLALLPSHYDSLHCNLLSHNSSDQRIRFLRTANLLHRHYLGFKPSDLHDAAHNYNGY